MSWFSERKVTTIILLLFLGMVALCIMLPISTLANGNIELKVSPGLGGEYKPSGWVPISVEVSNQGADLEGELILELTGHYNFSGTYYQPLSIATGATKKVTILVPGSGLTPSTEVKLVSKGEEVAKQKIGGRNLGQDTLFVGVLASDPETANFLATLPKNKFPMPARVIPLQVEEMPLVAPALKSLSMLVINNFSVEQLSREQIEAIIEWTRDGGLLVLAGGAHYEKLGNAFAAIAPVTAQGSSQINHLEALSSMAGASQATPVLERPFTISTATSVSGKVLTEVEQLPLFVVGELGRGKVLYVAYDLAEKPVADWSGNSSLWAGVLLQVNGSPYIGEQLELMEEWWPLSSAADRIPALKLPRLALLAIIFGIYILVVGPILYFVFKQVGKREWLWFIVPSLACLVAVGIYLYGSYERTGQVLAHHVSFVELDGQGEASLSAASAIFVPTGGDYTLRLTEGGIVLPNDNNYFSNNEQVRDTWISLSQEQAQVAFKNVEFWSMRKAAIQKRIADIGEITSDLNYADGKLVGTVTNNTNLALYNVRIFHGRHVQDFESIEPGETLAVELAFDTALQVGRGMGGQQLLPQASHNNEQYFREERMLDMLNRHYYSRYPSSQYHPSQLVSPITLIGWTEEKMYDLEVIGEQKKDYNLALVKAPLDVKPAADGYVFYPAGTFEAAFTESNVQVDHVGDGYMLPAGEITFEFDFNRELTEPHNKLDIETIHLYTWSNDGTRFAKQVYNWQTAQYEDYEQVFEKNKLTREKIASYLSPDGILKMKMEHQQQDGYRHLGHPAVSVEGKVQSSDSD